MALFFLTGLSTTSFATGYSPTGNENLDQPASGDVIVVQIGNGTARAGLQSDATPQAWAQTVRYESNYFKNDFNALMSQVYSKLNITNKSAHPVLVIEPDRANSWRRVDMSDVIMGTHGAPWMYVIHQSVVTIYANNSGSSSGMVYFGENNVSYVSSVTGGEVDEIGINEFNYNGTDKKTVADSVYWTSVSTGGFYDNLERLENIILCGEHFQNLTPAQVNDIETRLLGFNAGKLTVVLPLTDRKNIIFKAGQKLSNDGIMLDWDLAFTKALYQQHGSSYIRQWIW